MGRLAVRRVVYSGEKYSFESPYLNDGLVIMEGVNGHGKSTFMNLIYYGFGGRVQSFNKHDDNVSNENKCPFQIILTTGIDTYPEDYKKFVFFKLEGEKYLLQENILEEK